MTANRLSGAFFVALGLLLWFVILPGQTEGVDGGHMPPDFLPRISAALMAGAGLWLVLRPHGEVSFDVRQVLAVTGRLAIVCLGVYGISKVGFVVTAPLLAAVLMLLAGERRPIWLLVGVVFIPLGIWFGVVKLLGRVIA